MKIIGITGTIGTGKSTAAAVCGELGAATIDLDAVAHQLYADDDSLKEVLAEAFGRCILDNDDQINRQILADIVFNDRNKLNTLNLLVHPRIIQEVRTRLHIYEMMKRDALIIHGALLLDICGKELLDEIWVITSEEKNSLQRLKLRGMNTEEATKRRRVQSDEQKLLAEADVILENDLLKKDFEDLVQYTYELRILVPIYGRQENSLKS